MNEYQVELAQEALDNPEQAIQCLIDASKEIFNTSEADFEQMKSKKWYNRLWEVVTFSKDNEKKLAHGVSNLAKLQEIVTKALLVLSNTSREIAKAVEENASAIERLSKNQTAVIKEVEKLKYGYDRQLNLTDLGDNKRYIVVNTLAKLATETDSNEEGKQFVRAVMRAASFTSVDTSIDLDDIENLNPDEMALLYQLLQEYLYLATDGFESESEIFDYIELSAKKCQKIQKRIRETELVAGTEFFVEYYEANTFEYAWIDDADVEFAEEDDYQEEEANDTQEDVNVEMEEITLDGITHVGEGQEQCYKHKKIHFKTLLDCEGNLAFDSCWIFIGEDNANDSQIDLNGVATLIMKNCSIFMYEREKNSWINAESGTEILLNNCFLNGCGLFIKTEGTCELYDCEIINPGIGLVERSTWAKGTSCVKNCSFSRRLYPSWIDVGDTEDGRAILEGVSLIDNCSINKATDYEYGSKGGEISFVNMLRGGVSITHTTFEREVNCVSEGFSGHGELVTIILSSFNNCTNVILARNIVVDNSNFNYCTKVMSGIHKGAEITHCQFNHCNAELISTDIAGEGGVEIKYCEFNDWTALGDSPKEVVLPTHTTAMLDLKRYDKKGIICTVEKCIFNGITAKKWFVIKGDTFPKFKDTSVYVKECRFLDCETWHPDGNLIQTKAFMDAMFGKIKEIQNVEVQNCSGLNQVRISSTYRSTVKGENIEVRTQAASGATIGSTLTTAAKVVAGTAACVAGGPVGAAVVAAFAAVDAKKMRDEKEKDKKL